MNESGPGCSREEAKLMTVTIQSQDDWLKIANISGPVVDPMILRCGEIFLRGAHGANDAAAAWDLLTKNIHALGTFFDRLILDERIPVFDYADTFEIDQNFDNRTLSRVNANGEILVDVNVSYEAYHDVKRAALAELAKLYDGSAPNVDLQEAQNILGELANSGYAWYPKLDGLALPEGQDERLAAFMLGGLIFGGYAQLAGTDHLMQPKRSRLFLAVSLHQRTSRAGEEYLFESLGDLAGRPTADIPYTPTFFPLLLQHSAGPGELLTNALQLRNSGEVHDYREWLREALADFKGDGRIPITRTREVARIATAIQQRLGGMPRPELEIKVTAVDIDLTNVAKAAWGWLVEQLPGRRHRKLLTRAIIADREYVELDRRVRTVWNGNGLPG
jgi:hypothetical protein